MRSYRQHVFSAVTTSGLAHSAAGSNRDLMLKVAAGYNPCRSTFDDVVRCIP